MRGVPPERAGGPGQEARGVQEVRGVHRRSEWGGWLEGGGDAGDTGHVQ